MTTASTLELKAWTLYVLTKLGEESIYTFLFNVSHTAYTGGSSVKISTNIATRVPGLAVLVGYPSSVS